MSNIANLEKVKRIVDSGTVTHFSEIESGVLFHTESGNFKVVFYTNHIVRVHWESEEQDTNPYSVIQKPEQVEFEIEENNGTITLVGEALDVAINRNSYAVTFLSKEGVVINQDEPGLPMQKQGEVTYVYKTLHADERFIGLGEKTGPLDRRGKGYQNWNTDKFAYGLEDDPIYSSIPFYIGIHSGGTYGIFLDNSYKSHFNFGASNNRFSSFSAEGGEMNYYFFAGDIPRIIASYTWLTGRMELPPMWSLGYQQCRYSYYPDSEVLDVANKFRYKEIPADAIVLDIHYMDKYKIFTWDKKRFSDPGQLLTELKKRGFEIVVIFDPGIKIEGGYAQYEKGIKDDVFIKYPDGKYYEGEVWPGWCHFPDFTRQDVRDWWQEQMAGYTDLGVEGYWNDMNEIATWGQVLPENIVFHMEGEEATSRKARNVYGMQMARSTQAGAKKNFHNKRPFILTRSGFAGVQRYSAVWTGDNVADEEHMLLGVRLVNSLGLSGVSFAGYDVGGFAGDGFNHLFARWIQLGAFSPFFRGHSMINSNDSEPWAYGEEVEEISRNYVRLRYKLMPYIYQAFKVSTETGLPISRSLAINYPYDPQIFREDYQNQYLFGDSLLIVPLKSSTQFSKVYLPEGTWYDLFTDETWHGGQELIWELPIEKLPVFVKSSAIIPIWSRVGQNTQERGDMLEIHVYKGAEGYTTSYYEDDGRSYDYQSGTLHQRLLSYDAASNQLTIGRSEGDYQSQMKRLKIVLHGFDQVAASFSEQEYEFVEPISNFDPFESANRPTMKIKRAHLLETEYSNEEMVFTW